jgi:hypothetical protein
LDNSIPQERNLGAQKHLVSQINQGDRAEMGTVRRFPRDEGNALKRISERLEADYRGYRIKGVKRGKIFVCRALHVHRRQDAITDITLTLLSPPGADSKVMTPYVQE